MKQMWNSKPGSLHDLPLSVPYVSSEHLSRTSTLTPYRPDKVLPSPVREYPIWSWNDRWLSLSAVNDGLGSDSSIWCGDGPELYRCETKKVKDSLASSHYLPEWSYMHFSATFRVRHMLHGFSRLHLLRQHLNVHPHRFAGYLLLPPAALRTCRHRTFPTVNLPSVHIWNQLRPCSRPRRERWNDGCCGRRLGHYCVGTTSYKLWSNSRRDLKY